MPTKSSFEPVIYLESLVLILGTLPGDESLRLRQYYADPHNRFWEILEQVYAERVGASYQSKLAFLREKKLALWDVLCSAERAGSLDGSLRKGVANDFRVLFKTYPGLRTVAFNGSEAERAFRRLVLKGQQLESLKPLTLVRLPSTSGTPGRYVPPFEAKVAKWKAVLTP